MRVILGITDGDDAGAVLLVDGRMVAAVNEERLNRMKMSIGFPKLAIKEVFRLADLDARDVNHVAMAARIEGWVNESQPNLGWFVRGSLIDRLRNEAAAKFAKPLADLPLASHGFRALKRMTLGRRRKRVRETLAEIGVKVPISYHEHHRCHALAAYEASGYKEAVSISLDGSGDGSCSHVWMFGDKIDQRINRLDSIHSIGNFYAYVTHLCGFRANIHEGKITGLAASGEPRYLDLFREMIKYEDGQIRNVSKLYYTEAVKALKAKLPKDWNREDLASSIQCHLEEVAIPYIQHWIRQSKRSRVCLSGGVFANVLLNQKIAELPECEEVFIFPAMGDGGLAAGAAFDALRNDKEGHTSREDSFLPHMYLGSSFSDAEIETELKSAGVTYKHYEEIEPTIASLLAEGKVVARFNGAMEYGPRALGCRTIMYQPTDRRVNDWLNKRLNRTEFMPFAPACLAGHEEMLFQWDQAVARAARFMTITLNCSDWMQQRCPAVVHIDGTARPQIVDRETNPSFYKVIEHYNKLTGIPVIVNTSFNMHEEPIVCTPSDAIRSFQLGKLDNLAIGSYLLGSPPKNGF